MRSLLKVIFIASIVPLLASCATMSEDECRTADWHLVGFGDGAKGYSASRISSHAEACSKVGISPNLNAYTQGRQDGLIEYCKPLTGYRLGLRGNAYNNVCPVELDAEFSRGYSYGKELYIRKSELRTLERELIKEQNEYALISEEISKKEKRLVQDHVPKAKRIRLLEKIKELNGVDLPYTEARIESLQREIDTVRYDIARMKDSNPYAR